MTKAQATKIARKFHGEFVATNRQWDTATLESFLPHGMGIPEHVSYAGPCTINDIASFIRAEARPGT